MKVKRVRVNKGTPRDPVVKCRLVAQELGYGQRMDELFSGTPSLAALRLALTHAVLGGGRRSLMVLDVKCGIADEPSTLSFPLRILDTCPA